MKTLISFAVMIPFMTSAVVKVLGWYIVLAPGGPLNAGLAALGLGRVRVLGYEAGVLVGLVEFSLPLMIFLACLRDRADPARRSKRPHANLGAGFDAPLFFKVIVPMTWSGMLSGLLLCFGVSASAYVVPLVLGGSRVRMVANEIYDQVLGGVRLAGSVRILAGRGALVPRIARLPRDLRRFPQRVVA